MTQPTLLRPTVQLVAIAWLRGVPGVDPTKVATKRPQDTATWAATGFIQVGQPTGDGPQIGDLPLRASIVGVSCLAASLDSGKPPWWRANQLAEQIIEDTYGHRGSGGRDVSAYMKAGYQGAKVLTAYAMNDPRESPAPGPTSFAKYIFDLAINWVAVPD